MSTLPRPRRALAPRTRSAYSNKLHGGKESFLPGDDHCLNTSLCRVRILRAKTKDGPLVFRPWPALDYADPQNNLQPGRLSADAGDYSDWVVKVPVVKYAGLDESDCQNATFILYHPTDSEARDADPYRKLFYGSKAAHDAGSFGPGRVWDSMWNRLLKGGKERGAALSSPTAYWFAQGEVYCNGDKTYFADRGVPLGADPSDELIVLELNKTAGDGIFKLFDQRNESYDGDEAVDPSAPYTYGDPVGVYDRETGVCGPGWFFTVFDPRKDRSYDRDTSWNGEIAEFQGHEVALTATFEATVERRKVLFEPDLSGTRLQQVLDKSQFWFGDPDTGQPGLLHIPPVEEKCLLLAKGFWRVPKLLRFAWADNPEYFTDEVEAVLNRRTAAVMPGADDDEDEAPPTGGRSRYNGAGAATGRTRVDGPQPTPAGRTQAPAQARRPAPEPEVEGDEPQPQPARRGSSGGRPAPAPPAPSRQFEPAPGPDDDEDDDDGAPPPRGGVRTPPWEGDQAAPDDDGEVEAEEGDDDGDAAAPAPAPRGRRSLEVEEDEEDAEAAERASQMQQALKEAGVRSAARPSVAVAPPPPPPADEPTPAGSRAARHPRRAPR